MTTTLERPTLASMAKPEPIVGVVMAKPPVTRGLGLADVWLKAEQRYTRDQVSIYSNEGSRREAYERAWQADEKNRQARYDAAAVLVYDLRLTEKKTLQWNDGNYERHEAECLFLEHVTFHEGRGGSYCGGPPVPSETYGYIQARMATDVVGFMRKGFPVQKGRYNKSYGWNAQRASRAYIEGKNILFD